MEKFKKLGLSEGLLQVIKHKGFTEPSEIQLKTIPLVLQGKDVIGSSATGSGKTLAFGAGILDRMRKGMGIQTLILTPTRELAEQITQTLKTFSHHTDLRIREIYGGVGISTNPRFKNCRHCGRDTRADSGSSPAANTKPPESQIPRTR